MSRRVGMTGSFAKVARTQSLGAPLYHTCAHCKRSKRSALDHAFQRGKECRIRDGRAFTAPNHGLALGSQSCDAEGHSDAVIAEGFNLRAVERLSSGNLQAVLPFF